MHKLALGKWASVNVNACEYILILVYWSDVRPPALQNRHVEIAFEA